MPPVVVVPNAGLGAALLLVPPKMVFPPPKADVLLVLDVPKPPNALPDVAGAAEAPNKLPPVVGVAPKAGLAAPNAPVLAEDPKAPKMIR